MNYPVWEVGFGAGFLIALVAILHVFVSHFAVGGGLFLVVTERRARRNNDLALLGWLKAHTKFFVLVTVVFGAISGVGIWFTIGLIAPTATSNLIHAYVWGWAIEWVFFFVEIAAALLYLYGWDKLEGRLHEWFGWVYFIAAFASMVIINGILTFMLTSGSWVENHQFWKGFFNPTYFPSLAFRFAIALALAGVYALIPASVQKDAVLKARLVRWSACWIVPCLAVLPALGWWYVRWIPADVWSSARGPMPTATHFALSAVILLGVTFALALLTLLRPGRMRLAFSLPVALAALGAMGSFEFVREAIRKPYLISKYLYANSLYAAKIPGDGGFSVDEVNAAGILKSAKWISNHELTMSNQAAAGRDIFRIECESCHTTDAYRGVRHYLALRQWDQTKIQAMLGGIEFMHNGVMPPFAGTDAERAALAVYLNAVQSVSTADAEAAGDGETIFEQNCSMCHPASAIGPLFKAQARDANALSGAFKDLTKLSVIMPDLKLPERQRVALAQWVNTQRSVNGSGNAAQ
jgi:mono/diheme cytochrome c family protein